MTAGSENVLEREFVDGALEVVVLVLEFLDRVLQQSVLLRQRLCGFACIQRERERERMRRRVRVNTEAQSKAAVGGSTAQTHLILRTQMRFGRHCQVPQFRNFRVILWAFNSARMSFTHSATAALLQSAIVVIMQSVHYTNNA